MAVKAEMIEIVVPEMQFGQAEFCLLGRSPFVFNRMSEKARQQLLYPRPGRMTQAEKSTNIKHDPLEEFRSSVYRWRDDASKPQPTRLKFPANAFKKALAQAALDIPGAAKAQINRLVSQQWEDVVMYGKPQLYMAVVREGMSKTPNIRTRAILPRWATKIRFEYMQPILNFTSLVNLLAPAGIIIGVGDGRQEKGTFSFGQFTIVPADDPEYLAVLNEGVAAQDAALEQPDFYDEDSEDLYRWFYTERQRRGTEQPKTVAKRKKSNGDEVTLNA